MHLSHCDPVIRIASLQRIFCSRLAAPTMALKFIHFLTSQVASIRLPSPPSLRQSGSLQMSSSTPDSCSALATPRAHPLSVSPLPFSPLLHVTFSSSVLHPCYHFYIFPPRPHFSCPLTLSFFTFDMSISR